MLGFVSKTWALNAHSVGGAYGSYSDPCCIKVAQLMYHAVRRLT